MKKIEEAMVVLRFIKAEEGELPLDVFLRVFGKFNSAYKAALEQIIQRAVLEPERFGLTIASWAQGSTQVGLVAPRPGPGPLTPDGDREEPEFAPEKALTLLMETWEHLEDEGEISYELLPIVKELAALAAPRILRWVGPIEVRMPRRNRKRVYTESSYHAFRAFLEKPFTKPLILVGKLMEADFRVKGSEEKCRIVNPHLGEIRCSYPPSLEETIYHHLHPFRRNVKASGTAEIDKRTGKILRFHIEAVAPEAELFPWEDKENLEPTDFKRFVGMIPGLGGDKTADEIVHELRDIPWGEGGDED